MQAEQYQTEKTRINDVPVVITSYKIGLTYHCRVANADPGAIIARSSADTPEEAYRLVKEKAEKRL